MRLLKDSRNGRRGGGAALKVGARKRLSTHP